MENKTTHFLNVSLILVSLFCVLIFSVQTIFMNLMRADAIRQLGVIYMSGMSEQVASHFGTIIELRLSQVEALVEAVPPERFLNRIPLLIELTYNARSMGFEYLALYTDDNKFHIIYGAQVTPDVPEDLQHSVQNGKYNVCAGKDELGEPVVLMGIPAKYSMEDGEKSIALIAGFPASYLSDTLESNVESSMIGYSIIRNDGSYVLQNSFIEENNYFERIENLYETFNGKEPKQYAKELKNALEYDRDYTSEVMLSHERWNIYCTNLPNSEWHLLLKMSHNMLDETINILEKRWSFVSIGGCSLILIALLLVFLGYFRLTRKHMYALDEARKSADLARQYAERSNKAKSEFLSNISHDIRTPMNGIMGMTSIAISNINNPSRVRTCLKKINISSQHLLGLINDMLDMSKIESGKLILHIEPLSIRDIVHNVITIIKPQIQEKNLNFNVYIYNIYNENICSDKVRLSQIFLNILGNAVKFTPKNGIIEVRLIEEPSPKGDLYIRSILHIKDNGIGMSPEFQSKIFEAFAREDNARVDKIAGAGMGMTITKHIVDAMGGTITVESKQGVGSNFYVTLDMEKTLNQESDLKLPKKDILLIDDDETANEIAISSLKSIGLNTENALSLNQAYNMIEERINKGENYHIILLDWDIQKQNNIEIVKELKNRFGKDIPVIMLIDDENDELEFQAEKAGIDGFIEKPLFRSSLYYGLRKFTEPKFDNINKKQDKTIDLTGKRVLVAEDNELNWEIASAMLSEFGMKLDWAENGQICVEKFEQSEESWYDVILMDLRMPIMTGFEAASAIRKLDRKDAKSIPIIAVSADAFADDVKKCFDCGMNAHTAKPFDLMKIIGLINQYLD